jgi:hypothetical protein
VIPAPDANVFTYAVGEEVVVRLADVEVLDLDAMVVIPPLFLPDWTIGRIAGYVGGGGSPAYLLRTRVRCTSCICIVPDPAIEGLA